MDGKKIIPAAALFGLAMMVSGCGASRMTVIRPVPENAGPAAAIQVNQVETTAPTPQSLPGEIQFLLMEQLRKSGAFDAVSSERGIIALNVTVVSFDAGNQMERWFWGGLGNAGEGDLQLETSFIDSESGQELGKIRSQGTITSGALGGSIDIAYKNAVKQIVEYTVLKFGNKH